MVRHLMKIPRSDNAMLHRLKRYRPGSHIASCVVLAAVACLAGCQEGRPPTYRVDGKVAFADGSPLRGGEVVCESVSLGVEARGAIDENGAFQLTTFEPGDGAVEGEHIVLVAPARRHADGGRRFEHSIDDRYLDFSTSGLRCQVVAQDAVNTCRLLVTPPTVRYDE